MVEKYSTISRFFIRFSGKKPSFSIFAEDKLAMYYEENSLLLFFSFLVINDSL